MDRLSALPESLITVILALIPLKEAVRTSVLGSGWRHSWRSRPNFEINDAHFPSPAACLHFATTWIMHYDPLATIHSFSLTFSSPHRQHSPVLHGFIRFAVDHQTTVLDLDFTPAAGNNDGPFQLPDFVYQYDGLDALHLSSCRFRVSDFVNISWLKTASFRGMAFPNSALMRLLMSCPLLENLSVVGCSEATEFTMLAPRLRSLVIEDCPDLTKIAVIAENLRRFKFVGAMVVFGFARMSFLEEADIDLTPSLLYVDEEPGESIHDLLINFYRARVLAVCSYTTQVISSSSDPFELPRTIGARTLIVRTGFDDSELCGIGCLLNSCPSLEKLRFELTPTTIIEDEFIFPYEVDPETFWGGEFQAPRSISQGVQEVEIEGFGGTENEVRFLRFVVQRGGVLRKIRLKMARDEGGEWVHLSQDLPRIIRGWRYTSPYQVDLLIE